MKTPFLAFFLLLGVNLIAQYSIPVKVQHAVSGNSLAFANLQSVNSGAGASTDLSGRATISLSELPDRIKCSFIGFQESETLVSSLPADTLIISLEPVIVALQEVEVVARQQSSTGKEMIQEAIRQIKHNYPREEGNARLFYRELVREEGRAILVNEALADLHYTGYPQRNYVRRSWKAYWDDRSFQKRYRSNRECNQFVLIGMAQFFKYYNTLDDQCRITAARKSDNWSVDGRMPIINGGMLDLTAADKVKYLSDFFDPHLIDEYRFEREGAVLLNDEICLVVRFQPKSYHKTVHQPWNKKMQFPIFSGAIYISQDDFAIARFECQLAAAARTESYQLTDPWQIYPSAMSMTVDYERGSDEKWMLSSVETRQFFEANSSSKWVFDKEYECVRSLLVLDRSNQENTAFSDRDERLLKDVFQSNLRDFPVPYKEEDWSHLQEHPLFPPLSESDRMNLEQQSPLSKQYLNYDLSAN
jgi:hypothetical protein